MLTDRSVPQAAKVSCNDFVFTLNAQLGDYSFYSQATVGRNPTGCPSQDK